MIKRLQTVEFTVTADKIRGQGRPRARIFGKHVKMYKADEDEAWEELIRQCYFDSASPKDLAGFADEVHISIKVRRRLPKGTPKRVLSEPDLQTPDIDNICKSVLDALSGVCFKNDSQVTKLEGEKLPRVHANECVMEVTINFFANTKER